MKTPLIYFIESEKLGFGGACFELYGVLDELLFSGFILFIIKAEMQDIAYFR